MGMKAVILAGGLGTRLAEETAIRPKPMVEIGGQPILWHIMKIYSAHGITDFIICCGYKGYMIKEYFANYFLHRSDVTFHMRDNSMKIHQNYADPWKVTLIDTGEKTMTGGRIKRIARFLKGDKMFCLTYGDGVADVNLRELIEFHINEGRRATVTAVRPPGRFGALRIEGNRAAAFVEKPEGDESWINGGFFVLNTDVLGLIDGDDTIWEQEPLKILAEEGQLSSYKHGGFWQPMDTLRDRNYLEELWQSGDAPWKLWK